jgi:hypothetical protein
LLQLLIRDHASDVQMVETIIEPVQMLIQAKDSAIIQADTLEHPVTIQVSVVEDGDTRILQRHQSAVPVDHHLHRRIVLLMRDYTAPNTLSGHIKSGDGGQSHPV